MPSESESSVQSPSPVYVSAGPVSGGPVSGAPVSTGSVSGISVSAPLSTGSVSGFSVSGSSVSTLVSSSTPVSGSSPPGSSLPAVPPLQAARNNEPRRKAKGRDERNDCTVASFRRRGAAGASPWLQENQLTIGGTTKSTSRSLPRAILPEPFSA